MTALVLVGVIAVVVVLAYAAARAGRADRELDNRKRLEAMDERRAAANLTPERRLEVYPASKPRRHE
jgi:hypothetical protein